MTKALIQKLEQAVKGELGDEYMAMAYTIEQSLISSGAVPGKDYTHLDLYKLAQPFVMELFKTKDLGYDYAAHTAHSSLTD